MISLFNWFVKITGFPVQWLCFRTKIHYQDKSVQSRKIKGPAIIISNHTSVYDYAVFLFVFMRRTLRYQMAEILFKRKFLGRFLRKMGGIYVDRNSHDLGFMQKSEDILKEGGVVGIFPEGRLPKEGEERPIPFKTGAAYLALVSGVPVIPVYTDGSYFNKHRANVIIGKPVFAADFADNNKDDKSNIEFITEAFRDKVKELGALLNERKQKN